MLALADQKGKSLEQTHIFALAHILRRPIIVYGVKIVKNFRGENLGFANFEGKWMHASHKYYATEWTAAQSKVHGVLDQRLVQWCDVVSIYKRP